MTGWLQIIDLQKQHEGDYTCIAQNEHGVDRATARVNVVDYAEGLYHWPCIALLWRPALSSSASVTAVR